MSSDKNNPTIDDIIGYQATAEWKERLSPSSYEAFVNRLHTDLATAILFLQESANVQQKDEDLLTVQLVHMLRFSKYDASHDTNVRGHVDIVVKKNDFRWLAEAKVFSTSYEWLFKGMTQLISRYSTGSHEQNKGALIVYFFVQSVKTRMESWREKLRDEYSNQTLFVKEIGLNSVTDLHSQKLTFQSDHTHPISELSFIVDHFPVMLYHQPLDPFIGTDKSKKKTTSKKQNK